MVWLSNPLTAIPMYYPGFWLGCKLLQTPEGTHWHLFLSFDGGFQALLQRLTESFAEVVAPLCVGTTIVALSMAAVAYFFSLFVIKKYRLRRWGQLVPKRPIDCQPVNMSC